MAKQAKATATPRLRFPEFRKADAWAEKPLKELCTVNPQNDGLPDSFIYIDLESVEGGVLKSRNHIKRKSAPSRAQRLLSNGDVIFQVVRPYQRNNLFVDFRDADAYVASTGYAQLRAKGSKPFLYQLIHTDTFVQKVIEKCTGSNYPAINSTDLAEIASFAPSGVKEQQKVADCLTSLDEVVAAQGRKVEALKAHKRGLMQQLFPREGETRPRLRFPEFRDASEWSFVLLRDLEDKKLVELGRGNVISHDDMRANPGPNPVYSSSVINTGLMGAYGQYMFDEELISWSIDGGGHFFHRPKHKFSVTNVSGFMRVLSSEIVCGFLAYQLQQLHASQTFDYQQKAHPSVIRALYSVGLPDSNEQQRIADCLSSLDTKIAAESNQLTALKTHKQGLMQQLFPAPEAAGA